MPIFAACIALEAIFSTLRQRKLYALKDFAGSMSQLAMNILVKLAIEGTILAVHLTLYQYRVLDFNNTWATWLLTLLVLDFVFYFYHRASHRSRVFWAAHVVHHSSEYMNFGTALRQSPTGPLTRMLFYWPLPLLGFDPIVIVSAGAVATIYGFWTHTEVVKRWWWPLEYLFVSPAHHRVHHASNPQYIDKNYANMLIIWDHLFGTFAEEKEQPRYGLINNIKTFNPIKIAFHEWLALLRGMRDAGSPYEAWQAFIMPPDWKKPRPCEPEQNYGATGSQ
ncbi:MAG: sterol desaturase family protein [Halieaceae bacterium]|nr:sterol desaturase family protein [Halieaceae bacterium]